MAGAKFLHITNLWTLNLSPIHTVHMVAPKTGNSAPDAVHRTALTGLGSRGGLPIDLYWSSLITASTSTSIYEC